MLSEAAEAAEDFAGAGISETLDCIGRLLNDSSARP
jgi:hypothetical protein